MNNAFPAAEIQKLAKDYYGTSNTAYARISNLNWQSIFQTSYDFFFIEEAVSALKNLEYTEWAIVLENFNKEYYIKNPILEFSLEDRFVREGYSIDFSSLGPTKRSVLF